MAGPAVLKTKLQPPALRGQIVVRSLWQGKPLKEGRHRLIAVIAPAGSGKTTALVERFHHDEGQVCWLTLDSRDNDIRRFWRYIAYSLISILPGVEQRTLALLVDYSEGALYSFLDQLINELLDYGHTLTMILDDYHLIYNEDLHRSLNYFIDYLPESVYICIASRAELPFEGITRWLVNGDLFQIGAKDLAFNEEEAGLLCESILGHPLASERIERLIQRTEGWAAGLQLSLISLQQNGLAQLPAFSDHNYPVRHLTDYLFQEVMKGIDAELQQFLLRTSVLNRFDAKTCNAVTGLNDSSDKLKCLRTRGMFLIPLDQRGDWHRYHHLFGEFLENILKSKSLRLWKELNGMASRVYAEQGWVEEALDYAIRAEDFDLAYKLIDSHIVALIEQGEFDNLQQSFQSFPESYPLPIRLVLVKAFILSVTGHFDESGIMLEQIEKKLEDIPTEEDKLEWLSGLFFVKAHLAFASRQFDDWFRFAETIQHRLPEDPVFYNFNFNYREPFVRSTSFGLNGVITDTTAEVGAKIISILQSHGWENSLMCQYVMQAMAEGYYERDEIDLCGSFLERITAGVRYREVPGLFVPVRLTMAKLKFKDGDHVGARAILQNAWDQMEISGEPYWSNLLRIFLIELDIKEGRWVRAEEVMKEMNISKPKRAALQHSSEIMLLARLWINRQQYEDAREMSAMLRIQAEEAGAWNIVVSVIVLQAKIENECGNIKEASSLLLEAFKIGMPFQYKRTFLDEGEWLYKLLKEIDISGGSEADAVLKGYIASLLVESDRLPETVMATADKEYSGVYTLTPKEQQVLALLQRGDTNQAIADELGLTLGTVKVYLNRIYSKLGVNSRVQALLKTIPPYKVD